MSDPDLLPSPSKRGPWGRLRRANSHDDGPIRRNLFNSKSRESVPLQPKQKTGRVFGRKRSGDLKEESDAEGETRKPRFRRSPGLFSKRIKPPKKPLMRKTSGAKSDGDSVDSEDAGLFSSDENPLRSALHRNKSYEESLPTNGFTLDSIPLQGGILRKNVSFDVDPVRKSTLGSDSIDSTYSNPTKPLLRSPDELAPSPPRRPRISTDDYTTSSRRLHPRGERARYSVYHGSSPIKKRFRVRPYHCFPDPVHMTEEEIYADSVKPSQDFVALKSYLAPTSRSASQTHVPDSVRQLWGSPNLDGRIGAIRVEVLGCVSLNRTKPDVSVYAVCGDAAFCTDVLNGYRSPMWPSNSRRACIFPIHHAYAKLFVGVFDARIRKNKENDVFCGRVCIDICSIRPETEYDTTIPLRASSFVYDKRKRGVIRLRFSLHWFNERAAVLSYFRSVRTLCDSTPLVEGQPTIPCADPKTFRNVAVTVFGQDLPGKYSRTAFRATMREFNLYQQNLRHIIKLQIFEAVFYEKPYISLFLFVASIYCIAMNSVRMVPALFVAYCIILYVENYLHYVENKDFHLGYQPLTIMEVFKALVSESSGRDLETAVFQPISVAKRTKRRQSRAAQRLTRFDSTSVEENSPAGDDVDIKALDHREFPFSDRDAYPNFSVEDSLAPGTSKDGTSRLHGRLSVYYTPTTLTEESNSVDEDEGSDEETENDDETVMTESQMIGDDMYDLDSEAGEDEEQIDGADFNYKRAMIYQTNAADHTRRLRLGPPQDSDVKGRKVPPQVTLKKVENMLCRASFGLTKEFVHAPRLSGSKTDITESTGSGTTKSNEPQMSDAVAVPSKKTRRFQLDDFDKLLGLQTRSANPVHRIMSSFMGPLMRMIRVTLYIVRVAFNVTTWRDPYMSFWVLVMLASLCFILAIFPWRSFFLLATLLLLGPQVS